MRVTLYHMTDDMEIEECCDCYELDGSGQQFVSDCDLEPHFVDLNIMESWVEKFKHMRARLHDGRSVLCKIAMGIVGDDSLNFDSSLPLPVLLEDIRLELMQYRSIVPTEERESVDQKLRAYEILVGQLLVYGEDAFMRNTVRLNFRKRNKRVLFERLKELSDSLYDIRLDSYESKRQLFDSCVTLSIRDSFNGISAHILHPVVHAYSLADSSISMPDCKPRLYPHGDGPYIPQVAALQNYAECDWRAAKQWFLQGDDNLEIMDILLVEKYPEFSLQTLEKYKSWLDSVEYRDLYDDLKDYLESRSSPIRRVPYYLKNLVRRSSSDTRLH